MNNSFKKSLSIPLFYTITFINKKYNLKHDIQAKTNSKGQL